METRKFDGKNFYLDKVCGRKSIAQIRAKMLRDRKLVKGARIIEASDGWQVWVRYK